MPDFAKQDELEQLRKRTGQAEILAHIAVNLAFTALRYCSDPEKILESLERSFEAGLTELTFSQVSDEDIVFYKNTYRSYLDQFRLLSLRD